MRTARFILPPEQLQDPLVTLLPADAQHARVLRLRTGDRVRLGDGQGREYAGVIRMAGPKHWTVERGEAVQRSVEAPVAVTLFQAWTQDAKFEWVLQKTAELGVRRVVPMRSLRTGAGHAVGAARRARWLEIARQSVRQSERLVLPDLGEAVDFPAAVEQARALDLAIMPWEEAPATSAWKDLVRASPHVTSLALLIGPEGGFSEGEAELAQSAGVRLVSLGPRILRTETAGVVSVALALYAWADMGGKP